MTPLIDATPRQLVINWHITEVCNYSCGFCFAKWEKDSRELFHSSDDTVALLNALSKHFDLKTIRGQIGGEYTANRIRLNIAGGEPMLYRKRFGEIVKSSHDFGMDVSCITNGSRMDEEIIRLLTPVLTILGVSVDATCEKTNIEIGRVSRGSVINLSRLCRLLQLARSCNPEIQIKINTVVNAANWSQDLSAFITAVSPDKWKIFKVLPTINDRLAIGDMEYNSFLRRHRSLSSIITAENNTAMRRSYLMIDPLGRFYQNREAGKGMDYSDPILDVGVEKALSQVSFNADRFNARY